MSDDPVRDQYEAYPYPDRNPADEGQRLITGSPSHLDELNHYVFAGGRDFAQPFRALVAGGGTGDGAIMLAQQLSDRGPGEVVYIDLAEQARFTAEARAAFRGLNNIRFERLAIEDLADAGLGTFDYIDCCGVLHHLADPAAGLAAIGRVLADDGGMGMMLYGTLGRTGVYPMQAMLRAMAGEGGAADRVARARRLLAVLPETNWLRRNDYLGDHLGGDDAGLFDLLLHDRDRAYEVTEIAALVERGGFALTAFVEPARYDPESYIDDEEIRGWVGALPWIERCAFAERLAGNMRKHVFYAVKAGNPGPTVADPSDPAAALVLRDMGGPAFADKLPPGAALTATIDGFTFHFPLPPLTKRMSPLFDGRRSIAEIRDALGDVDDASFTAQFNALYRALNGLNKLYLRNPGRPG
jgi:SAM-dependent methyltransferase